MAYGTIKVDTITFTDGGIDKSVAISGLVQNPTFTGNVTVTGTVSGNTVQGQTISGVTVTGTTANFTSGNFTNISGGTHTITSGVFAAGTAANPSISFTSDPNTGIYSPGADQVAISTNGTGRLFIDSAGKVGVGTFPGTDQLTITGNLGFSFQDFLVWTQFDNSYRQGIRYSASTRELSLFSTTNDSGGVITFYTRNGTGASSTDYGTERMRLDSSGRLGLGTSSPSSALDVAGAISLGAVALPSAGTARIFSRNTDSNLYIQTGSGNTLNLLDGSQNTMASFGASTVTFQTGNSARLTIDSSGRVGIGTTSPSTLLHLDTLNETTAITVAATTSTGGQLRLGIGAKSSGFQSIVATGNGLDIGTTLGAPITFFTNGTANERARIDSSGRLLVGTSSSSNVNIATFQGNSSLSTGTGIVNIALGNTSPGATDQLGRLQFTDSGHNSAAEIVGQRDGGTWNTSTSRPTRLVFSTTADGASSPTERMRIGNSGQTDVYATTATVLGLRTNLTASTSAMMIGYNNASSTQDGTIVVVIRADGDLENANNSYGAYSDKKLKENVVGAGSQWSDIKSLTVRKFNFKKDTGFSTHTQIGLIAQEVELVSPGLVTESPDRDEDGNDLGTVTKSVNYSVLYMKAVKALQEAMERIETLEAKVAALESK